MTTYHYVLEGSSLYWNIDQRVNMIFMILINANEH